MFVISDTETNTETIEAHQSFHLLGHFPKRPEIHVITKKHNNRTHKKVHYSVPLFQYFYFYSRLCEGFVSFIPLGSFFFFLSTELHYKILQRSLIRPKYELLLLISSVIYSSTRNLSELGLH